MNVSLQNIDKVSAELTVKLEKADYQEKVDKELKSLRQKAQIPGFRKGMVPTSLIKKMYGKSVIAEVVNKALQEAVYNYIKDNKVNMLGEPLPNEEKQQNIDFDTMEEFEFVFDIALAPEFKAEVSAKDKVDYYSIEVSEEMIDNQVKMYTQRTGKYDKVDAYEDNDMLKGLLAQLDEEGNTKEGGIQVEAAVLMPAYMKNDDQKAIFANAKVNDVLVEVEAASICGTDVHVLGNPPGFIGTKGSILGHECVGTVREIGDGVEGLKVGDRVVLVPNIPCGYCESCRQGKANMCENEKVMGVTCDGVFAKYFVAPEVALTKIPDDMDKDLAIFAEPVKCVMGAMDWVRVLPGETVLILGGGPIGLYFIMLMKANGAGKIIVSEPSEYRAKYAMDCGADIIIDPTKQNLAEEIAKITGGRGVDISVDAVGVLINDAIVNTCKGGRIVLMGQNGAVNETICQNDIVSKGLSIFGNYIGNYIMSRTVKTLEAGIIPVEKIITHKLPMSKFAEGLDAMRKGVGLEVILYPDEN